MYLSPAIMTNLYKLALSAVRGLQRCGPYQLSDFIAVLMPFIPRRMDQFHVVVNAAIRQHELNSNMLADRITVGVPRINFEDDLPFESLGFYFEESSPLLVGWPVNFAIYNSEVYLHMKYMGVGLSKAHDKLHPVLFHRNAERIWTFEETSRAVRNVYMMVRNLLRHGLSVHYLESVTQLGVDSMPSPFGLTGAPLPMHIPQLVAREEIVEKVLRTGAFEYLDAEAVDRAIELHTCLDIISCPIQF